MYPCKIEIMIDIFSLIIINYSINIVRNLSIVADRIKIGREKGCFFRVSPMLLPVLLFIKFAF